MCARCLAATGPQVAAGTYMYDAGSGFSRIYS